MATYAIGDVQGCAAQLSRLIDHIGFNPGNDRLWFVGDLVNRGPDSIGVLRLVKSLGDSTTAVLGNHDLFLLAAAAGIVTLRSKDTIQDVLDADDRNELVEWLRNRPLHHREQSYLMVHAGLLPQWTADEAGSLAGEVERFLAGSEHRTLLHDLFHGPTLQWDSSLRGTTRLAAIARVLTRLRTCTPEGGMSSFSGAPENAPPGYRPWFSFPDRRNVDVTIVTGHWAALGLHLEPNLLAIDSGCVWGRELTAIRLEDRAVFQVEGLSRR